MCRFSFQPKMSNTKMCAHVAWFICTVFKQVTQSLFQMPATFCRHQTNTPVIPEQSWAPTTTHVNWFMIWSAGTGWCRPWMWSEKVWRHSWLFGDTAERRGEVPDPAIIITARAFRQTTTLTLLNLGKGGGGVMEGIWRDRRIEGKTRWVPGVVREKREGEPLSLCLRPTAGSLVRSRQERKHINTSVCM